MLAFLDFIPFFSPKRVHQEMDMPFDQKMQFCWTITILDLFQNLGILANISNFLKIFLCQKKAYIPNFKEKAPIFWVLQAKNRPPIAMALTVGMCQNIFGYIYIIFFQYFQKYIFFSPTTAKTCRIFFSNIFNCIIYILHGFYMNKNHNYTPSEPHQKVKKNFGPK